MRWSATRAAHLRKLGAEEKRTQTPPTDVNATGGHCMDGRRREALGAATGKEGLSAQSNLTVARSSCQFSLLVSPARTVDSSFDVS